VGGGETEGLERAGVRAGGEGREVREGAWHVRCVREGMAGFARTALAPHHTDPCPPSANCQATVRQPPAPRRTWKPTTRSASGRSAASCDDARMARVHDAWQSATQSFISNNQLGNHSRA
jgi:hypothetical protein